MRPRPDRQQGDKLMQGILLCVDDEVIVLSALRDQLRKAYGARHLIEIAESAEEGLEILGELSGQGLVPLVVISDFLMPGMKGDEFLIQARQRFPYVVTVLLSGQVSDAAVDRVRQQGHLDSMIAKPWDAQALLGSIDAGLARFAASRPAVL
ncbi:response regulator [Paucibacter sediminis]|uniref:Response regulator n=1 Tax=Paucibacter sediminis TaxID=3019553 RepID=A0AA95SQ91_9BURK|nr:response regulator [Paucibacter sp. S2-9]WIT13190.1 response regulator [Paucibacter sp. S2-9]